MSCRTKELDTVDDYLAWSRHESPIERKKAAKSMCPCTVRADLDVVWERLFEMTFDENALVRDQALHALGDGSPRHLEERVVEAVERLYNDPDASVKKKARRMLNSYRRTGRWNVL